MGSALARLLQFCSVVVGELSSDMAPPASLTSVGTAPGCCQAPSCAATSSTDKFCKCRYLQKGPSARWEHLQARLANLGWQPPPAIQVPESTSESSVICK